MRFAVQAESRDMKPFGELCAEYGISRQTGYLWLNRYRAEGAGGVLVERSRAPRHRPGEAPSAVISAVAGMRGKWPDWGARKLHRRLSMEHPELATVSVSSVHRVLVREGLIRKQDRHQPAVKRFEREAPNQLWQMDFKGPKGFRHRSGPLSLIDDHSRFVLVLKHLESARIEPVRECLTQTFTENGLPDQMLIDHGTPWWNANSPWGWTELTVWIMLQGIRVYLSGVRHPQTQGKVERMHGNLHAAIQKRRADADQQSWLDEFRHEYNHVRPHEALAMETPASRWKPSLRPFRKDPEPWRYPVEQTPIQLNHQGQMNWRGRRWEVSRALQNQTVGLEITGHRALIYFCNTPVQEIDITTRKTTALPVDPFGSLQC